MLCVVKVLVCGLMVTQLILLISRSGNSYKKESCQLHYSQSALSAFNGVYWTQKTAGLEVLGLDDTKSPAFPVLPYCTFSISYLIVRTYLLRPLKHISSFVLIHVKYLAKFYNHRDKKKSGCWTKVSVPKA